jgi:putative MFS transporter
MLLGSACTVHLYGGTAAHAGDQVQLIVFGLAMQFFLFGIWSVLYAYTPELYPTRCRVTLGRIAEPDEIVGTALHFATDASSYLTGQCITLDGGGA